MRTEQSITQSLLLILLMDLVQTVLSEPSKSRRVYPDDAITYWSGDEFSGMLFENVTATDEN